MLEEAVVGQALVTVSLVFLTYLGATTPPDVKHKKIERKPEPVRGLCLMKRSDGSGAMKEDDRKEGNLGETA